MDASAVTARVEQVWEHDVLPALHTYIGIPNQSQMFDPGWAEAGHMAAAVELVAGWCRGRAIAGIAVDIVTIEGRPPVVVVEIPAFGDGAAASPDADRVLLYGHLDKQPPMLPWRDGLDPWTPVREGDRLYGRGAADDGYAAFASLTAIEAAQAAGGSHARCLVLIEAGEESGSPDLPEYVELLADRIGTPGLVICLDSFCATYDRVWLTTSLRGLAGIDLTVEVLEVGVHSGSAGGVVPSTFRVLRQLIDRIEDPATGALRLPELHAEVPDERTEQIAAAAATLGALAGGTFPLLPGVQRHHDDDVTAQLRARTWEPALELVGIDGVPPTASAGNVLRPRTRAKLSIRLPPTVDADEAAAALTAALAADPPHGAHVTVAIDDLATGWNAPALAPWFAAAIDEASTAAFGQPAGAMGEGGTIPFMAMLGERFPHAQFAIVGVLGPGSGAHGPDEFLHVPMAKGITVAMAHLLDAHTQADR